MKKKLRMTEALERKPEKKEPEKRKTSISIDARLMEDLEILAGIQRKTNSEIIEEALQGHFSDKKELLTRAKELIENQEKKE